MVDSFKFLPRLIATFYKMTEREPEYPIPWTPLKKPLSQCKVALVTSGGVYHRGVDEPFDMARERDEPTWGDPTYRVIPSDIAQDAVGVSHLHINTANIEADVNVVLPFERLRELVAEGAVGSLADEAYSFMGFQGFPADTTEWQEKYGIEVAKRLKSAEVDCVLLTPT